MAFGKIAIPFLAASLCLLLLSAPTYSLAAAVQSRRLGREPPCTGSFDWLSPQMLAADCAAAIEKLRRSDRAWHGSRDFEFIGKSGRKTTLLHMRTPRRYTAGTCTLVIAMLNLFPEADLPDPPKHFLGSSDVTSFEDLYLAAISVQDNCVAWLHQAGYQQEGKIHSIGVFLMATDSIENHFNIPPGVNPADRSDIAQIQSHGNTPLHSVGSA